MEAPIGTYHIVPEATLMNEVMGYRGFYDHDELVRKKNDLFDLLDYYARFLEAGCPTSPEWFDGDTVTEARALEVWDMLRQLHMATEKAITFVESDTGKKEAHYENLRRELRYMEKTLDDIGGTTSRGNLSGLLAAIRETEQEMETMDAESRSELWVYNDGPSGKEYMNYEVGEAWCAIMKSMGRESAITLVMYTH
jgi:hypothetical protein